MSKDTEKMDKREKELTEENKKLYDQWKQVGENIQQQNEYRTQIVAKINQNAGAIKEIQQWKEAMKAKEDNKKK